MKWLKVGKPSKTVDKASQLAQPQLQPGLRKRPQYRWPTLTIDLSRPRHRRILLIASLLFILASFIFLFGSYKGYEYTESAEFCGTKCHPMAPQFTRYERSPHANVDCVKCHIGPGASFFVKSKIDGIRQVIAVMADTYQRPIKSPVHNLRPARETCETCHTPTSFKDNIVKTIVHYDNDQANTRVQSTFLLKMGGWQEGTGLNQGIHWHINSRVYYIAADEQRQVMLWVGVQQPDGSLKEYFARDMLNMAKTTFVEKARAEGRVRLMDCIDCHNRTAHYIPNPAEVVDQAISVELIPISIPSIRAKAIEVLSASYSSQAEAYITIDSLADFFNDGAVGGGGGSEEFLPARPSSSDITRALDEIKRIYANINFPEMNLNWETNPNNEKHTPSLGCFRCHDGKHVSVDAAGNEVETISVKCNLCHTVPIVGRGDEILVEAPVIVGTVPPSHSDFRWTVEHRSVTDNGKQECFNCHGKSFCNNGACHNLSHPENMLFTHADEYRKRGGQVCYTCHQNILCSRCHPGGIVSNP